MSINGIGPRITGMTVPNGDNDRSRPGGNAASGASRRAVQTDRVEISDAGRSLANEMPPELADIRAKIDSGAYDNPSVAEETARRILASGDLGEE